MPQAGLGEAAKRFGISKEALRKRILRGTIQADKDPAGRWLIDVDETEDTGETGPGSGMDRDPEPVAAALKDEISFLRRELETRTEELRRKDSIIMALTQRLPELPPPFRKDPDRDHQARREAASIQEQQHKKTWWKFWGDGDK